MSSNNLWTSAVYAQFVKEMTEEGNARATAHKALFDFVDTLECDDNFKVFMKYRVGADPSQSLYTNALSLIQGFERHERAWRSMNPGALVKGDIDYELRTAIRDINESGWVGSEWCCAGHKKDFQERGKSRGYLCLIVPEVELGALMTIVQKVRNSFEVQYQIRILADLMCDYACNDLGPTHGCHRLCLEFTAREFEHILLWRQFCRKLGRKLKSDGAKRRKRSSNVT